MTSDNDPTNRDVSIPPKSVDPTESVSDRMTDNAQYNIGPNRYFQKNQFGEPLEDWSDVFERVGTNVSIPEAVFADRSINVYPEDLSEWVDDETIGEFFADTKQRTLDEEIAPYVDYDSLVDRVPDDVAADLRDTSDRFESAMAEQRFMPNTPTLINAGTELQQLSACFVLYPGDSLVDAPEADRDAIMDVAKEAAAIFKSGGGVGYPLHLMRPKGARIKSTEGVSSGPMSFAQIYDTVCGTIQQGGVRRGAQMAVMHSQHPDIGRFAIAKRNEENLSNFNISVGLSDDFLDAVSNDEDYLFIDPSSGYIDPEPFEVVPETAHFYDPEFEDAWNDEYNKPGIGLEGKTVQDNFWRDHVENMQEPELFEKYKDQIDLEVGEPMELPAGFIYQMMIDGAHHLGEPGFYYIDETNRQHSFDVEENPDEYLHCTNPCGEQSLTDGEPCNLGHINLSLMVDNDAPLFEEWMAENFPEFDDYREGEHIRSFLNDALDMGLFEETARTGARFLDNVVTMSKFPLDKIETEAHGKRKIGLGLMGFHQMLLQLGIEYGELESYAVAREIMRLIDSFGVDMSHELAQERGTFERYDESKWSDPQRYDDWFESHAHRDPDDHEDGFEVRNHNMTTIAPTGTTSMISNTTGGCEPIYKVAYFKNVSDDVQGEGMLVEFDDYFIRTIEHNDLDVEAVKEEAKTLMDNDEFSGVDDLTTVPSEIGNLFVTTEDLDVEQHIRVQAAFQEYCDSSISKTLNIANDATIEDVGHAIDLATSLGVKGGTIYRIDSRTTEVMTTSSTGGAMSVSEADTDDLLEELSARLEDDDAIEADVRAQVMKELDIVDTTVEVGEVSATVGGGGD